MKNKEMIVIGLIILAVAVYLFTNPQLLQFNLGDTPQFFAGGQILGQKSPVNLDIACVTPSDCMGALSGSGVPGDTEYQCQQSKCVALIDIRFPEVPQ